MGKSEEEKEGELFKRNILRGEKQSLLMVFWRRERKKNVRIDYLSYGED